MWAGAGLPLLKDMQSRNVAGLTLPEAEFHHELEQHIDTQYHEAAHVCHSNVKVQYHYTLLLSK